MQTFLATIFLFCAVSAQAATLYFDPVNGSGSGDGSRNTPYADLQSALQSGISIDGGDTLKLMPGFHGRVVIANRSVSQFVTIDGSGDNQSSEAKLASLNIANSHKWRIKGVSISPYNEPAYNPSTNRIGNIVSVSSSNDVEIIDNDIFTIDNISAWTADDWNNRSSSGVSIGSEQVLVDRNRVRNINFGISIGSNAHKATVSRNQIINFAGDALRGLGDDGLFEFNIIANAFDVNDNHDDGFQAFTNNRNPKIISRVTLRGNQFYYNLDHPNLSLIGAFQGIGCFDGFFNDWVIENNLLYINHWHGITLLGANNARIVNNTLIDAESSDGRLRPWIKVAPLKESLGGQAGSGNITRNNIAEMENEGPGIVEDSNLDPRDFDLNVLFVDYANNNFELKQGSPAIDAGNSVNAPTVDIRNFNRVGQIDIGAYEFGARGSGDDYPGDPSTPIGGKKFNIAPILLLFSED